MPLTRYQIRSEGRLADPELYRATDKDDPEGILEGVAMASLVGVLRQLGDLAEFAAEVFHDLHEEVMSTSSRGHGLLSRVKQLEADFPPIQKTILSQTDHSKFYYNKGVDYHPNLHLNQNLVTGGDLPRFIMDSYEECRGPPRLFLLDKFDMAGAGACLKRYTNPSYFKVETTSFVYKETEVQKDKKNRRFKKKGSRWRNGEAAPEAVLTSHAKLHELLDEERTQNLVSDPSNHVTLKRRQQLNGFHLDSITGKSYMEHFLESNSCEQDVTVSSPSPINEQLEVEKTALFSPHLQKQNLKLAKKEGMNGFATDGEVLIVRDAESATKNNGSIGMDNYHSDDVSSEMGNYVDAFPLMESGLSPDSEYRNKYDSCIEKRETASDSNGVRPRFCHSRSGANSSISDGNSSFKRGMHSSSFSDTSSNLAENVFSDGYCGYPSSNLLPVCETISGNESHDLAGYDSLNIKEVLSEYTTRYTGLSNLDEHASLAISDHAPSTDTPIPQITDEIQLVGNSMGISPSSDLISSASLIPTDIQGTTLNPDKSSEKDLEINEALSVLSFDESENLKEVKLIGGAPTDLNLVLCNATCNDDDIHNFSPESRIHFSITLPNEHNLERESPDIPLMRVNQSVESECLALSNGNIPENPIMEANQIVDVECLLLNDQSLNACLDEDRCYDLNVPPSESCSENSPGESGVGSREKTQSSEEIEKCYDTTNRIEANLEETPPLPPLPPMQWRIGKPLQDLKPSKLSEMGDGDTEDCFPEQKDDRSEFMLRNSPTVVNNLEPRMPAMVNNLELPILTMVNNVESPMPTMVNNPELPIPTMVNNVELSFPTMVNNLEPQMITMVNNHDFPMPTMVNNVELSMPTVVNNAELQMPTAANKDDDTKHDLNNLEESPPAIPSISLHENVIPNSLNPLEDFVEQIEVDSKRDDMGSSLPTSAPLPCTEDGQTQFDLSRDSDDEKWNEKIFMRIPRPPDPLIKAVAAHDKTKLKKVSERVGRENEPQVDQRDSVLEQIRTKSFNLKPAAVARPNIQGPATNLKVAAILERANAIRQAFAGSDEDDDDDTWSQC